MAQYRLSANMIGRSAGRSATAAAAYRAGERIVDELTGEVHDYTRKGGVMHTEILAPQDAPDWMLDRSQLWNGVEAVERRKDAQLAREIQLSLPHELNDEQRANLVRMFAKDQFIARGMIADIAIHAPSSDPAADERNFHAHVMLTTRTLLDDSFGKKDRAWNDADVLEAWREAWADQQNREFERLGLAQRVDHRSLSDQGILREPQKHLGPIATEIERDGRNSHRGNENRDIQSRNGLLNDIEHAGNLVDAKILFEQRKFEAWSDRKREKLQIDKDERQAHFQAALDQRVATFESSLDAELGQVKDGLSRNHEQVADRLDVRGWRKFIRDITLTTRKDRKELEALEQEKGRVQAEEDAKRAAEDANQESMRAVRATEEMKKARLLEQGIEKAKARREAKDWAMGPGKGVADPKPEVQKPEQKSEPAEDKKPPPKRYSRSDRFSDRRDRMADRKGYQSPSDKHQADKATEPKPAETEHKPDIQEIRQKVRDQNRTQTPGESAPERDEPDQDI